MELMTILAVIAALLAIRSSQRMARIAAKERETWKGAMASRLEWLAAGERVGAEKCRRWYQQQNLYRMGYAAGEQAGLVKAIHQASAQDAARQRAEAC